MIEAGKLPPGALEQMKKHIDSYKKSGYCTGVELLAGPECKAAEKHNGQIYGFDNIPDVPFSGCNRSPCCACDFLPVIDEQLNNSRKESEKMSLWKKILVGVGVFWLIGAIGGMIVSGDRATKPTMPEEKKKPTLSRIASGCEAEWELARKKQMKDPGSLDWDHKSAELGMYKSKPVVMVPYRAKNGFGALDVAQAICKINPDTGEVIEVVK